VGPAACGPDHRRREGEGGRRRRQTKPTSASSRPCNRSRRSPRPLTAVVVTSRNVENRDADQLGRFRSGRCSRCRTCHRVRIYVQGAAKSFSAGLTVGDEGDNSKCRNIPACNSTRTLSHISGGHQSDFPQHAGRAFRPITPAGKSSSAGVIATYISKFRPTRIWSGFRRPALVTGNQGHPGRDPRTATTRSSSRASKLGPRSR